MTVTRPAAAVALAASSLVLAGCSALGGGGASPTPSPTAGDEVEVISLGVGDCLGVDGSSGATATVPVVECSQPHDSEAYAEIELAGDDFPGATSITQQAESGCSSAFTDFVGIPYDDSGLDYAYYFPTEGSWAAGDRRILCVIVEPGTRVTGSLSGAAR